jgi:hypothetical protein
MPTCVNSARNDSQITPRIDRIHASNCGS